MCGILGKINLNSKPYPETEVSIMKDALRTMQHRGPDNLDAATKDYVTFGHVRLSIIDLSEGASQPFFSDDGRVMLTFNGEIYNFGEIRKELEQHGYHFRTDSDTEVLLNAYLHFGIECIQKFVGMFAFAIYDAHNQVTYIVRDRLGIKPVYYHQNESEFIFSSEIKGILNLTDKASPFKFNKRALSSYLSFRYPILDETFFEGIQSLSPGHYLEIKNGNIKKIKYWNPAHLFAEQKNDKGEQYYLDTLKDLLKSSIEYRMISDVPFGAFLSGGVDSSVITAIMAKASKDPIKTFTIGFEEEGYNEFDYAKMVADRYKTNHFEILLSGKDYMNQLSHLISIKDAPLSVPNEVPLYLMSKELKKHITVVLSGEGADEIMGGYGRIFRSPLDFYRLKNLDKLDFSEEEKQAFKDAFVKKYGTLNFENEVDHFMNIYSYTGFSDKRTLLSDSVASEKNEKDFKEKFNTFFNELKDDSYYNKLMYAFERVHILGLLHRVDTTTMATSVEARVPFVDHRLIEFAFTIPVKYKLKWKSDSAEADSKTMMSSDISEVLDTPKYLLKKAYEPDLPHEVLYRKKMGFPVPLNNWFGNEFNTFAKDLLLSESTISKNLINQENIKQWLEEDRLKKDHSFAMKIWMLINMELFLREYQDRLKTD